MTDSNPGSSYDASSDVTRSGDEAEFSFSFRAPPKQKQQQKQQQELKQKQQKQQWKDMIRTMVDAHGKAAKARKPPRPPTCPACGAGTPFCGRAAGCKRCREVLELHAWVVDEKKRVLSLVAAGYRHWEDMP